MLSDRNIALYHRLGTIVIDPFDPDQLGPNSYDVRLGEWYFAANREYPYSSVDITNENEVRWYWGESRQAQALSGERWLFRSIVIPKGQTILAHTQEVVGGKDGITTEMRARSSVGRSGISVCKCAGIGDVGYVGRWTMEITNHSAAAVVLPVGLRVAQILFHKVGQTDKQYTGKYGAVEDWKPEDMLPKLWLDKDKDRWGK